MLVARKQTPRWQRVTVVLATELPRQIQRSIGGHFYWVDAVGPQASCHVMVSGSGSRFEAGFLTDSDK